ncbi:hypothetical protein EZV62_021508 [Acer yangbiense]|uniref:Uncharacterized protein n=1 Tax=Acer yangbiense TaxID=1000413 RepID=A0A5C7H6I3_9ROSI|nr:hypothetical protein EZV62_021508 [Acer yangbiense]
MISRRVGVLIRTVSQLSLQRLRTFSSSSSSTHPRLSTFFSDEAEGGSAAYRRVLKTQRPTMIEWEPDLVNSVNLIGSVDRPLKRYQPMTNEIGVYTLLSVKGAPDSNHYFRILLAMQGDMATLCEKHLKLNDYIYVSGRLKSYTKADHNGDLRICYKVDVKDLNYVAKRGSRVTSQKSEKLQSGQANPGEAGMEKYQNRLYLWHVFFTNPHEWWDNRKDKKYPNSPDFKHKDTGEVLWFQPNDPPWIKKQLQLIDSKMAEQGLRGDVRSRSKVSTWVYDDFGPNLGL